MIARTRTLMLKQFESDIGGTVVRLTAKDGRSPDADTFVTMKLGGSNEELSGLIEKRGKLFRVTIEEVE